MDTGNVFWTIPRISEEWTPSEESIAEQMRIFHQSLTNATGEVIHGQRISIIINPLHILREVYTERDLHFLFLTAESLAENTKSEVVIDFIGSPSSNYFRGPETHIMATHPLIRTISHLTSRRIRLALPLIARNLEDLMLLTVKLKWCSSTLLFRHRS
jgi:hypothetical protein